MPKTKQRLTKKPLSERLGKLQTDDILYHEYKTVNEAKGCKDRMPGKIVLCMNKKCDCNYKKEKVGTRRGRVRGSKPIDARYEFKNCLDAYKCKNRMPDGESFCITRKCTCNYKDDPFETTALFVNVCKLIPVVKKIEDEDKRIWGRICHWYNKLVPDKYTPAVKLLLPVVRISKPILPSEFILMKYFREKAFVYRLDLYIPTHRWYKPKKPAFEVFLCEDRIESKTRWCDTTKIRKKGLGCCSSFCGYNKVNLEMEAVKEVFIQQFNDKINDTWDRTVLTFDWGKPKGKQGKHIEKFIKKHLQQYKVVRDIMEDAKSP